MGVETVETEIRVVGIIIVVVTVVAVPFHAEEDEETIECTWWYTVGMDEYSSSAPT